MKKMIFILITMFAGSLHAKTAGVLTEPYAGYFSGDVEGPSVDDGDVKSYAYGARLGYETESGMTFGIDYSQGKGDFEPSASTEKFDITSKDGGVFIGYNFPAYIKVWATYVLKHEVTLKEYNAGADMEMEGTGFNLGIGIRGIPFVSVNLTYQERKIEEVDGASISGDNKSKLTLLSLSLPYNFPWKP